jgi:hypothetical protein
MISCWSSERKIFSDQRLLELKNQLWDAAVAACPQPNYRPACALSLPALNSPIRGCTFACRCCRKTSATDNLLYAVWPWSGLLTARRVRDGCERRAELDTHGVLCRNADRRALHRDRYGISASRPHSDRKFRSFRGRRLRSNAVTADLTGYERPEIFARGSRGRNRRERFALGLCGVADATVAGTATRLEKLFAVRVMPTGVER